MSYIFENSLIASIGSSVDIQIFKSIDDIAKYFEITSLGKAPARYDKNQLVRLNSQLISSYSFEEISKIISNNTGDFSEEFWDCIKQNISEISEINIWLKIINEPVNHNLDIDKNYLNIAQDVLPMEPWDKKTWDEWIEMLKDKTQKRGKDLFMPIRLALTGKTTGPELNKLILLMGYNKVLDRLKR